MNEREFQIDTVKTLRKFGFTVWVTSTNRKSRNTVGCPDLIVSICHGFCLAIELKGDGTRATVEQNELQKNNEILILRPCDDVLSKVFTARKYLMSTSLNADNKLGVKNEPKSKTGSTKKSGVGKGGNKSATVGTSKTSTR